jgi:hypothetical protein
VTSPVRRRDVFIVQSTGAPVGEHTMEVLLLADAALGAGARSVSAVVRSASALRRGCWLARGSAVLPARGRGWGGERTVRDSLTRCDG